MKTKGCSFYPTHALPQKITVLCVDAIWLINSWNKCVLDVYTKLYHLWLREPLSFMLLTAMGVCDGEVSPIAFPYSFTWSFLRGEIWGDTDVSSGKVQLLLYSCCSCWRTSGDALELKGNFSRKWEKKVEKSKVSSVMAHVYRLTNRKIDWKCCPMFIYPSDILVLCLILCGILCLCSILFVIAFDSVYII